MKIDTTKNFSKFAGSLRRARGIVRNLLDKAELLDQWVGTGRKGSIVYARGTQNKFRWYYDGQNKTIQVTYTDGRPEPVEKTKPEYFIVWIEGLEPKGGEKILSLDRNNHEYTKSMTKAMRVKLEDIDTVKQLLRAQGVTDWAVNGTNTFHRVNYAPKGTLFKL